MIAKKLLTTIAFAFVLLFSGCADDDFNQVDGVCPLVIATAPEDGAIDVPLNQVITATFNEKMNPSTITEASFTVGANDAFITGNVTYSDSTAVFTPSSLLDENTEYTGTIKTLAKDERGNALQEDYMWTFVNASIPEFSVVVSSDPTIGGITIGGGLFEQGAAVTVTATPNDGYTFVNWTLEGVEVSTDAAYTFVLTEDTALVVNYEINTYTLQVIAVNGTVAKNPDQLTYTNGDNVELTATPDSGYEFTSWSGDATGTNNPLTVLMNANKNITANFSLIPVTGGLCPSPAVDLGTSRDYAILAESGISTTGTTSVTGDMGLSPQAATFITGFGLILDAGGTYSTSSLVTGKVYAADYTSPTPANLTVAVDNMHTAFTTANGLAPDVTELLAGNLNGQTLAPGVYKWDTGLSVTNSITLDGGGQDCAAFVFQIAGDLTIANGTQIILTNGAKADNIYWVVAGSKAELGTSVNFSGNILSKTLISVNTGSEVKGRLLAQTAVTLDASSVVIPSN